MLNILLNTTIEYRVWNDIEAWTGNSLLDPCRSCWRDRFGLGLRIALN
jgi:hypothetical protein